MKPKKKIPTLYASNLLVKEVYQLNRKIDATYENISDWREEYYCENPAEDRAALLSCMKRARVECDKWSKRLERIETRLVKQYGKGVLGEIEYIFRWKNFGSLKYVEKRKIKLNNL